MRMSLQDTSAGCQAMVALYKYKPRSSLKWKVVIVSLLKSEPNIRYSTQRAH